MNKKLLFSNFGLRLYRLYNSKRFDFEIEKPLPNGDCISLKTSDNARLTKHLEQSGICANRLQAINLLNHGFVS